MMNKELKINHSYLCIKGVKMENGTIAYKKDKVYKCEVSDSLTDEQGDIYHCWPYEIEFNEHFIEAPIDNVNHPPHYTWLKDKCGIEVIDITRHMDFNLGNAIKYILRAGHKQDASLSDNQKEIEYLKKAVWYINDKIKYLENRV